MNTARRLSWLLWSSLMVTGAAPLNAQGGSASPEPVDRNASPEVRALLRYLYSISGRYTLSGQHNFPNHGANWTNRAYDFSGKYPAVYGQDFGFQGGEDKDSVLARPALIEEAKRQYRNGAIVTLTWHAVRPTDDEPVGFSSSVQGKLTDFEWSELTTPGTRLNQRWCEQVDVVAGYLRQLRDARVPVLWRPLHEVNGSWFWWGGRPGKEGSSKLYRLLFDRLVNRHKLNNLVWVWNANAPGGGSGPGPYADYFPGVEYADVLSVDIYGPFQQSHYTGLQALAGGKPLALGEVGANPTPAVLKQQPGWTWFMTWADFVEGANSPDGLRELYHAPMVLGRDDAPLAEAMAATRKASAAPEPEPVTPESTAAAKALLARLYRTAGEKVLSGQENAPGAPAGASAKLLEATGKAAAIYGQDLGVTKEIAAGVKAVRQAIIDEVRRQHQAGSVVSLTWRAARPFEDEPAPEAGMRAKLSDFEWAELTTPGTRLYQRWCSQVDEVAGYLKQLQDADIAVLWRPYPQPNGARYWWAGRKGAAGSAALYRQLYERLTVHHRLRNLVWVWTAAAQSWSPDSPGPFSDFFPGLPYIDAVAVEGVSGGGGPAGRMDWEVARFAVGKPAGIGLGSSAPVAEEWQQSSRWSWFLAPADALGRPEHAAAWVKLYASPRVAAR